MRTLAKYLMLFLWLFGAQAASAQEWNTSQTTPVWSNTVAWTPPIPVGDAHPFDAFEHAPIDELGYDRDDWVGTLDQRIDEGTALEAKFRTEFTPCFTKRADPIVFRGQYPAGHPHTFFGACHPYVIAHVEDFDYEMGRTYLKTTSQGGPLNGSLYWEPSILDQRYGITLARIPAIATAYYTHNSSEAAGTTRFRFGTAVIGGADPANYNDTARRAEYAAAGLEYPGSPDTPAGANGVQCFPIALGTTVAAPVVLAHRQKTATGATMATTARYLVGPDHADPWDGACTAGYIIINSQAPACQDPNNLTSPNGRDHFRYSTRDEDDSPGVGQCPSNFVKIVHFATKVRLDHDGWVGDLEYLYLSSDRMRMATAECPDPTAPCDGTGLNNVVTSKSPCRSTGIDFCAFETNHFDLIVAWDTVEMKRWQARCGGVAIAGFTAQVADCGSGGTDDSRSLLFGGVPPDTDFAVNPMVSLPTDRASASTEGQRYFPINPDDQVQGGLELDVHGGH